MFVKTGDYECKRLWSESNRRGGDERGDQARGKAEHEDRDQARGWDR